MPEIDPLDPSNCLNQKVVELEAGGSHTFKERSEDMGSWQGIIVINVIIIMINIIINIIMGNREVER